mmetsp:Transcript_67096/g.151700  ORF Transcript_67096/g.151700 Transcript_67096/m.151700 type:complete len:398 (+) Transcript_67096:1398-2591(+)
MAGCIRYCVSNRCASRRPRRLDTLPPAAGQPMRRERSDRPKPHLSARCDMRVAGSCMGSPTRRSFLQPRLSGTSTSASSACPASSTTTASKPPPPAPSSSSPAWGAHEPPLCPTAFRSALWPAEPMVLKMRVAPPRASLAAAAIASGSHPSAWSDATSALQKPPSHALASGGRARFPGKPGAVRPEPALPGLPGLPGDWAGKSPASPARASSNGWQAWRLKYLGKASRVRVARLRAISRVVSRSRALAKSALARSATRAACRQQSTPLPASPTSSTLSATPIRDTNPAPPPPPPQPLLSRPSRGRAARKRSSKRQVALFEDAQTRTRPPPAAATSLRSVATRSEVLPEPGGPWTRLSFPESPADPNAVKSSSAARCDGFNRSAAALADSSSAVPAFS